MTRAAELYDDCQPDPLEAEFGGKLNTRLLLKVVRDLALRDEDFASKQADETSLIFKTATIAEEGVSWEATRNDGDEVKKTENEESIGENISIQPSKIETIVSFSAKRFFEAELDEDADENPKVLSAHERVQHYSQVGYTFAVEVVHEGAVLPADIAVEYMCPIPIGAGDTEEEHEGDVALLGHDDEEDEDDIVWDSEDITRERAIELGQRMFWTLKQRWGFSISTGYRYLDTHESQAYYDDGGNVINASCSCQDPDCDFSGAIMHEEVGEQLARMTDESGSIQTDAGRTYEQVKTPDGIIYAMRPHQESLYDADNAIKLWETADAWKDISTHIYSRKDQAAKEDEQLRQAFMVLSKIQTKLNKMAGIKR